MPEGRFPVKARCLEANDAAMRAAAPLPPLSRPLKLLQFAHIAKGVSLAARAAESQI
jgi:hypothetical protein